MRVALLELTPESFVDFCKAFQSGQPRRIEVVDNPLPEDAEVVGVFAKNDPMRLHHGTVLLHIKSESFADVPEGGYLPELPAILFKTVSDTEEESAVPA